MKKNWCTPVLLPLSNGIVQSANTVATYETVGITFNNYYSGCSGQPFSASYCFNASGSYSLPGPYNIPGAFSVPCTALGPCPS